MNTVSKLDSNHSNIPPLGGIEGGCGLSVFFNEQLRRWDDAAQRYEQLNDVRVKHLTADGSAMTVQFNPARMVSTGAKIDAATLRERPCFLCEKNRPSQQMSMTVLGRYYLLVNPFPILKQHFTIPLIAHEPQSIASHFEDMMRIATMMPDMMVFYNGPRCGASAPDHMHFQAGSKDLVPLIANWNTDDYSLGINVVRNHACLAYAIVSECVNDSVALFNKIYSSLDIHSGDYEPMMNVVAWTEAQSDGCARLVCIVIPRSKHRPNCYFAEGDEKTLVSPGALDMAGLIITPREEDFNKMDAALARSIIEECGMPPLKIPNWGRTRVCVGILMSDRIRVTFNGLYTADDGRVYTGDCEFTTADAGMMLAPSMPDDDSFTLHDVVIGIGFHWQRTESQTFRGALRLIDEDGMLRAVNVVPVETYLTSVISSEMSATASLELLKAHAVISRSWLMRQMDCKRTGACHGEESEGRVVRWYDSESHTLFDVCADDHCQRYQGITRQSNPNVVKAIEATRGEVLMCDGEVCDARFSKCCGGVMETFENCWDNTPMPYLVGKEDIVRAETTRNHGIVDAYCNTRDKRILSQVLNNYDQETTDFYRWAVTYDAEALSSLVARKSGIDFGRIIDLVPVERGVSGRITLLRIVGEKRTVTVGKELEIRKWLSESHLYSSAFDVVKAFADGDNGHPVSFTLNGRGWGHGVGLCQIGAAVMGEQGFSYAEILSHYYPNTTIERLW